MDPNDPTKKNKFLLNTTLYYIEHYSLVRINSDGNDLFNSNLTLILTIDKQTIIS